MQGAACQFVTISRSAESEDFPKSFEGPIWPAIPRLTLPKAGTQCPKTGKKLVVKPWPSPYGCEWHRSWCGGKRVLPSIVAASKETITHKIGGTNETGQMDNRAGGRRGSQRWVGRKSRRKTEPYNDGAVIHDHQWICGHFSAMEFWRRERQSSA